MENNTPNKTLDLVAKIFSVAFQPILMPIFCMVLVFEVNDYMNTNHEQDAKLMIYALCMSFTIILPIIVFGIFYKLGFVTDVNLTKRKERVVPFFLSILLFATFYYLVRTDDSYNTLIHPIIFGCLFSTFIANNITMFWKISIHCLGISGVLGAIVGLAYMTEISHTLLITGLTVVVLFIGVSRVILKRHTIAQVIAGTSLGFFGTFLSVIYGWYI